MSDDSTPAKPASAKGHVIIYNATDQPIKVTVNNGSGETIPGSDADHGWLPVAGTPVEMLGGERSDVGKFHQGLNANEVEVDIVGAASSQPTINLDIEEDAGTWRRQGGSMIFFYDSEESLNWVFIKAGVVLRHHLSAKLHQ